MLTQKRLKELLHYNPNTGIFTWKRYSKNKIAGGLTSTGYIRISVDGKRYHAHRLAFLYMTGEFPPEHVDHINHNKIDNRWKNLRPVSKHENEKNLPKRKHNTSGVTGVGWHKAAQKWEAWITVNYKKKHLGLFTNKSDATKARKSAQKEHGFHENHGT